MKLNVERVLIGIGSNLFNPICQVNQALCALADYFPWIKLIAYSSYYNSRPLGEIYQPNFLNVVVVIDTILSPFELLNYIQWIETQQGRVRNVHYRWFARSIDIDILLFGNKIISTSRLIIPHYDMLNREFVLYPLFELMPNICLNGKMLSQYLKTLPKNGLKFWSEN